MNGFRDVSYGWQQHLEWMQRLQHQRLEDQQRRTAAWWWNQKRNRMALEWRAQRNSGFAGSQAAILPGPPPYSPITLICPVKGCETRMMTIQYRVCRCPVHNEILVDNRIAVAALRRRHLFFPLPF